MKREEFERVKGIFTAEFVSSNLISENAAFHKHPNKKRPRDATVVCIKSLHIHKGPLALASKDFGKHFKLHCCLIGGEHCNGNASRVAIVRVPWFDGEWTAANICACIRFKTFEEASRAIQEEKDEAGRLKEEKDKERRKAEGVPGAPITLEQQQILASALLKALNADSVSEALSVLQSYTVEREVARKNAFHKKYCGACRRILCLRTYALDADPDWRGDLYCSADCCPSNAAVHEVWITGVGDIPSLVQFLQVVEPHSNAPKLGKVGEPKTYDFGEFAGAGYNVSVEAVLAMMADMAFEDKYEGVGVKGLLKLIGDREYVTFNCMALVDTAAREVIRILRGAEVADFLACHGAAGLNDGDSRSLVLIGISGTGSGVHVDRTQALNVAFGVKGLKVGRKVVSSDENGVLAWWLFLHPDIIVRAAEYSKVHFGKDFSTEGGVILNTDECLKLQREMGRDGQGGLYVRRVAQCAGQVVVVPPGWCHQVVNVQECVKFAIDFYDIGNASLYMDLARDVAAKVFGKRNAHDYMGATAVIVNAVVALMAM